MELFLLKSIEGSPRLDQSPERATRRPRARRVPIARPRQSGLNAIDRVIEVAALTTVVAPFFGLTRVQAVCLASLGINARSNRPTPVQPALVRRRRGVPSLAVKVNAFRATVVSFCRESMYSRISAVVIEVILLAIRRSTSHAGSPTRVMSYLPT